MTLGQVLSMADGAIDFRFVHDCALVGMIGNLFEKNKKSPDEFRPWK